MRPPRLSARIMLHIGSRPVTAIMVISGSRVDPAPA